MRNAFVALAALSTLSLVGCGSSNSQFSFSNLTPELAGLHDRPSDVYSHWAIADNANLRMASDDMTRIFLINQSSRLSPFPVSSYSGNPF